MKIDSMMREKVKTITEKFIFQEFFAREVLLK